MGAFMRLNILFILDADSAISHSRATRCRLRSAIDAVAARPRAVGMCARFVAPWPFTMSPGHGERVRIAGQLDGAGYGATFTVTGSEAIPLATTTSEYWPAGTLPGTVTVVLTGVVPVATPMVEWSAVGR